jgi:hypothetical protein
VQLAASASIAFPLCQTPPAANWFTSFIGTFDADVCNVNLKGTKRKERVVMARISKQEGFRETVPL